MSNLTDVEKICLEKYFQMDSGYVLDFSNRTFKTFILEHVELDIYADKYALFGDSKAKRLRAFWQLESDDTVAKLIGFLIESIDIEKETNLELREKCLKIVERLKTESMDDKIFFSSDIPEISSPQRELYSLALKKWYLLKNDLMLEDYPTRKMKLERDIEETEKQCREFAQRIGETFPPVIEKKLSPMVDSPSLHSNILVDIEKSNILNRLVKGYEDRFGKAFIYAFFVILSLFVAIILFGVLDSSGIVDLYFPDYVKQAKFGGAASVFLITLLILIHFLDKTPKKLEIKGTVYDDEDNNVIANAMIRIEGDNRSTQSDHNGYYTLELNQALTQWCLTISYDGQNTQKTIHKNEIGRPVCIYLKKKP